MRIETLSWFAERRAGASHGAFFVIAFGALILTLAGVTNGRDHSVDPAFLLNPTDAATNGLALSSTAGLQAGGVSSTDAGFVASEGENAGAPVAYFMHEVAAGESLGSIADRYGVSVDSLIWNNPEVFDPDLLIIGANLLIPGVEGIVYDVRVGDTINDIALTYNIDPQAVIDFGPNALATPDNIIEGMVLVLPGAVPPPPPVAFVDEPGPADEGTVDTPPDSSGPLPAAVGGGPAVIVPSIGYIWPVPGPVWSGFGPRWGSFHKGIDIGAGYGTGIGAAGSGLVVLATYRDNGYGNYVIVQHSDGSETLYAHMSQIYVAQGQYVNQGDVLGAVGCTGWCTGDHLHFEIHIGGAPVDPLGYLP